MTQLTLLVCSLCRVSPHEPTRDGISGGQHLIDQLQHQLQRDGGAEAIVLQPVRCMAACDQACNLTLTAPGKLTFILNNLAPITDAPAVIEFCRQYAASVDGRVPYGNRSELVKRATAYVLPPLSGVNGPKT